MAAEPTAGFDPACLDGLDEPVRRYLTHAIAPGAPLIPGMRLNMTGRINVGLWLPYRAWWQGDGRSFAWGCAAGPGGRPLLRALDQFADGAGSMDIRLRGGLRLVHAADENTARSGAGRAAVEAVWAPVSLLSQFGVDWRADSDELIVATRHVAPEQPEVRLGIDGDGRLLTVALNRWLGPRDGYVSFGGQVLAERRFGTVTLPSTISVGWRWGTPDYKPFFEATLTAGQPHPSPVT